MTSSRAQPQPSSQLEKDINFNLLFLLTAHHPPCQLNRTFRIGISGKTLYLCTRCLGQWIGFVLSIGWGLCTIPAERNFVQNILVFGLLPLPVAIDWSTQTLGYRESNNPLRMLTGLLYGASLGQYISSLFSRDWPAALTGASVYFFYMLIFWFVISRPGIASTYLRPYEEFIREHFTEANSV
jgi:uncharacterized membrane protein